MSDDAGEFERLLEESFERAEDAFEVGDQVQTRIVHIGGDAVFVDMGGGSLMPHEVVVGTHGESYTEIVSGVEPGQRVVTSAQFLLDSESNLAEVMQAMMAQMNMSDMEMRPDTIGGR